MSTEARFDQLVEEHKDAVYRQMVRACGNREDAEDVLSEALLNAYRSLGSLQDEESFRAWLAMIGRRICGRMKKRESLMPLFELSDIDHAVLKSTSLSPEESALEGQLKECLFHAVEEIPEPYRETYQLADLDGLPLQEAADSQDVSLAAFKSRLHRARQMLRENLDRSICSFESD
jgi:RNA polymerase sigma-70 factor (ECF subfamily)